MAVWISAASHAQAPSPARMACAMRAACSAAAGVMSWSIAKRARRAAGQPWARTSASGAPATPACSSSWCMASPWRDSGVDSASPGMATGASPSSPAAVCTRAVCSASGSAGRLGMVKVSGTSAGAAASAPCAAGAWACRSTSVTSGASRFHQLPGAELPGCTDDSARQCLARVMAT